MVLFLSSVSGSGRHKTLQSFYSELGTLAEQTGGPFYLNDCDGHQNWPTRGIYVFFSPDTDPAIDPVQEWHISRIGTVGDSAGSSSSLWERLRQHRGNVSGKYGEGGGNHRGSIMRKHIGRAIIENEGLHDAHPHWGTAHRNLPDDIDTESLREQEHSLEQRVSDYIRSLPFVVIDIPGEPGPDCDRVRIEKNLIALVSHARRTRPRLMRDGWIGHASPKPEIHKTGLWNIHHVSAMFTNSIVGELEPYIKQTDAITPSD